MVTFHPTHMAVQSLVCGRVPCFILNLRATSEQHNSPTDSFIVLRPLPTTWSTEIGLPMDSQVVAPLVWGCNFPASPGCRHLSSTFLSSSASRYSAYGTLPCLGRCSCNPDSRVTTCSNVIVGPVKHGFLILRFT